MQTLFGRRLFLCKIMANNLVTAGIKYPSLGAAPTYTASKSTVKSSQPFIGPTLPKIVPIANNQSLGGAKPVVQSTNPNTKVSSSKSNTGHSGSSSTPAPNPFVGPVQAGLSALGNAIVPPVYAATPNMNLGAAPAPGAAPMAPAGGGGGTGIGHSVQGQFMGLPDFGISEALGLNTNSPLQQQLRASQTPTQTTPAFGQADTSIQQLMRDKGLSYGDAAQLYFQAAGNNNNVLGSATANGGAPIGPAQPGAGGQNGLLNTLFNPVPGQPSIDQVTQQSTDAAKAAEAAAAAAANNQSNLNEANLNTQLGTAQSQYGNITNLLGSQQADVNSQLGSATTAAQQQGDQNVSAAYDTAQATQRANRNTLRALGILDSSAAGNLLTQPFQQADKAAAATRTQVSQQLNDLHNQGVTISAQLAKQAADVSTNFQDQLSKIQNDQRFTYQQRYDAQQQLQAALQQTMATIQSQKMQWDQAIQTQKNQFLTELARNASFGNPGVAQGLLAQAGL